MEAIGHMTTSACAAGLRIRASSFADARASTNGNHTARVGADELPRGIAAASEQSVGIRVFATGGDV